MKKIIPALALLLVSAVMLATSSFAWFSMNTTVAVTGMSVTAKVNDNLQIAQSTTAQTDKEADSAFKYGYVMSHTKALLEPVSSINGVDFFYTSTKNVNANGNAASDKYVAYDPTNTSAFNVNYGTQSENPTAVGYVDYAVQLKADNSKNAPKYVNLSTLTITYAGTTAAQKAFRVAVFVDDMGATGATAAAAPSTTNLKTILKMDGSTYFDNDPSNKAVASPTELGNMNSAADQRALIGSVDPNSTRYFKVVVRLWIEGEDTTCTNGTFASLTDTWDFDLKFTFDDVNTAGVNVLTQSTTASKPEVSGTSGSTATVIDGQSYYQIGETAYYLTSASSTVANNSIIYTIDSNNIVLDVTNRVTLPN